MKQDRLSTLRQRLKRGSFEFGALLEGVSTLEEKERAPEEVMPAGEALEEAFDNLAIEADPPFIEELPVVELETVTETVARTEVAHEAMEAVSSPSTVFDGAGQIQDTVESLPASLFVEPELELRQLPLAAQPDRLRVALESLGWRLLQELGSFRAAVTEGDSEEGGFHLAHVNQVLELLQDIDPDGDLARQLGTVAAPPSGRAWPASSWTVVEFASSPFSGLLPPKADDRFVRDLLYSAWGVAFEPIR